VMQRPASKVDGSWTAEFVKACAELGLQVLPSAREPQTSPVERTWQTLSQRMCAMMLNQGQPGQGCVPLRLGSVRLTMRYAMATL
jgi:hypothetical protein